MASSADRRLLSSAHRTRPGVHNSAATAHSTTSARRAYDRLPLTAGRFIFPTTTVWCSCFRARAVCGDGALRSASTLLRLLDNGDQRHVMGCVWSEEKRKRSTARYRWWLPGNEIMCEERAAHKVLNKSIDGLPACPRGEYIGGPFVGDGRLGMEGMRGYGRHHRHCTYRGCRQCRAPGVGRIHTRALLLYGWRRVRLRWHDYYSNRCPPARPFRSWEKKNWRKRFSTIGNVKKINKSRVHIH